MAGPYNIRDATYTGLNPDPVEWANEDVKPAITDLDLRVADLEDAPGGGAPTYGAGEYPLLEMGQVNNALQGDGWVAGYPLSIEFPVTFSEVSIFCFAAVASANVACALYSASSVGGVGTLAYTFGTADCSTTGEKKFTGTWNITPGLYYGVASQVGGAVGPQVYTTTGGNGFAKGLIVGGYEVVGNRYLFQNSGVLLPGTITVAGPNGGAAPYFRVKVVP